MNRILPLVVVIASAGTVPTVAAPADTLPGSSAPMGQVEHAPLMNVITLGLMQVGAESKFLLRIADAIGLDEAQRATLASLLFAFEADKVRREADLRVAEAELNRLLTRENVDLVAVRAKIDEAADIASEGARGRCSKSKGSCGPGDRRTESRTAPQDRDPGFWCRLG
jgi:Spy/CpxP family protein refolding chaperone